MWFPVVDAVLDVCLCYMSCILREFSKCQTRLIYRPSSFSVVTFLGRGLLSFF